MFPTDNGRPELRGFEVLERLGAGGVGSVYLARSRGGRLVAVKMLGDPRAELDAAQKASLAHEASLAARLSHPAIVQVRAFVQDAGYAALVFEYVDGIPLSRLLRLAAKARARLPDRAAFAIVERVLAALSHAHAYTDDSGAAVPIVHRDVSPSNVLLDWEGNVKLTDFGMAKLVGTSTGTQLGLVHGTLGCMAPEQARGESVTERADVYAAGLLSWWLATGRAPFARFSDDEVELLRAMKNPRLAPIDVVRPDLPRGIQGAIRRALAVDPKERTLSAAEFRAVVQDNVDCARGEAELRALLTSSREALEALGPDERSSDGSHAGRLGPTRRYEDGAQAVADDSDDTAQPDAVRALPPLGVELPVDAPLRNALELQGKRASLPSLDELTVLSQLTSAPPRFEDVIVSERQSAPPAPPVDAKARLSARPSSAPSPAKVRLLILLVAAVGVVVGAGVAWLAVR